jgi:Tfp pilus assembly protein PilW
VRLRQAGLTMVELVVGMAVGVIVVMGILVLVEQAQRAYFHSSEATDLQQNVRVGMDRMVRVIQAAGVNPRNQAWGGTTKNDPAFTAFREAGQNCVRVYADLDGDGTVQQTDENVYFHWAGGGAALTEERGTSGGRPDSGQTWVSGGSGDQELARDIVANPGGTAMFRYFTGVNDPLGAPNTELVPPGPSASSCSSLSDGDRQRISRVVITLTGQARVGLDSFTKTITSDVRARNVP